MPFITAPNPDHYSVIYVTVLGSLVNLVLHIITSHKSVRRNLNANIAWLWHWCLYCDRTGPVHTTIMFRFFRQLKYHKSFCSLCSRSKPVPVTISPESRSRSPPHRCNAHIRAIPHGDRNVNDDDNDHFWRSAQCKRTMQWRDRILALLQNRRSGSSSGQDTVQKNCRHIHLSPAWKACT